HVLLLAQHVAREAETMDEGDGEGDVDAGDKLEVGHGIRHSAGRVFVPGSGHARAGYFPSAYGMRGRNTRVVSARRATPAHAQEASSCPRSARVRTSRRSAARGLHARSGLGPRSGRVCVPTQSVGTRSPTQAKESALLL